MFQVQWHILFCFRHNGQNAPWVVLNGSSLLKYELWPLPTWNEIGDQEPEQQWSRHHHIDSNCIPYWETLKFTLAAQKLPLKTWLWHEEEFYEGYCFLVRGILEFEKNKFCLVSAHPVYKWNTWNSRQWLTQSHIDAHVLHQTFISHHVRQDQNQRRGIGMCKMVRLGWNHNQQTFLAHVILWSIVHMQPLCLVHAWYC